MPNRRTLENVVQELSAEDLRGLLERRRMPTSGSKDALAKRVVDQMLLGEITVAALTRDRMRDVRAAMCVAAGLDSEGSRPELRNRLEDWVERNFGDQIPVDDPQDDEDDTCADDPLDEDQPVAPGYRESAYATTFFNRLRYDAKRAATEPRDYQRDAVRTLVAGIAPGRPLVLHVATGGGKTWIANDVLSRWLRETGGWVLWVTKDWRLLRQAAEDLARRHRPMAKRLRRVGGAGSLLHPLPELDPGEVGVVAYTTLHTLGNRLNQGSLTSGGRAPSLVVWDECHWGENATSGRRLRKWCRQRKVPLLGLTATPRPPEDSEFQVACSIDFVTLVEREILARPIVESPVRTGFTWAPDRDHLLGDFTAASLRELAEDPRRNGLIVQHYVDNVDRFQQTIVFACSIEHAEKLAARFKKAAVPVGCVHSHRPERDNEVDCERFSKGELQVLINVAKLTHGVDVPRVRTIFLCRPTMSDMLFSQMIGRGSRRDPSTGKTEFHVVEFTDNLTRFADQLRHAKSFFDGARGGSPAEDVALRVRGRASSPPTQRHAFDALGRALWIPDHESVDDELRGLWVRDGQTFGIEFELTRDDWSDRVSTDAWSVVAEPLRRRLSDALPGRVAARVFTEYGSPERSYGVWNVERDNSCGWEVISRVLVGPEGFREVVTACRVLAAAASELGLRVNHKTGTHVHLGWSVQSVDTLKRAIRLVKVFEPALATLVAPSRVAAFDRGRYDLSVLPSTSVEVGVHRLADGHRERGDSLLCA
jgi:superfamily II DNA or RNA helicase